MKRFHSYFYKKCKVIITTAIIYAMMFVALIAFIVAMFETICTDSYLTIAFLIITPYTLFMLLRALYFIFEKIEVDTEKCEIKFCILRKTYHLNKINAIKRVRPGQLRIETANNVVPFSVEEEENFIELIKKVAEKNITTIIVTHEMAFAKEVANKIIFMDGGVIAEQGSPKEIFDNPKCDRLKNFLSKL